MSCCQITPLRNDTFRFIVRDVRRMPVPRTLTERPVRFCPAGAARTGVRDSAPRPGPTNRPVGPTSDVAHPGGLTGRALALVLVASFMVVLDFSIVNVALPSIRRSLDFGGNSVQWVVTAYAITFGGLLILGGRTADILGRRRMFVVGLILFAGASRSEEHTSEL